MQEFDGAEGSYDRQGWRIGASMMEAKQFNEEFPLAGSVELKSDPKYVEVSSSHHDASKISFSHHQLYRGHIFHQKTTRFITAIYSVFQLKGR